MIDPALFATWLRKRRRLLDWTQADLAARSHYALSTIRKLEAGDLIPSQPLAESLADCLAVPLAQRDEFVKFARGRPSQFLPGALAGADLDAAPAAAMPAGASTSSSLPAAQQEHTPEATPASLRRFNLPAAPTSLIGREREVAEIVARLRQPGIRLLTLTGPPGAGKTRLSLAAAAAAADHFADGVHFVALAAVSDPMAVIPTLAHSLGVSEASALEDAPAPMRTATGTALLRPLGNFLHARHLLLVIDNFEQLLGAAPAIGALLAAAPGVKILATSRELLRLYGEFEFAVSPLALPSAQDRAACVNPARNPAGQLFAERAQAVQPTFTLTAENAVAVTQICARLDGLPLAIEMAAAQLKWLSLEEISAQLASMRLHLRRAWRDADPRQHSLRGAIEWSYQLLPAEERRLFCWLGSFVGGCTAEAVQALQPLAGPESPSPLTSVASEEHLRGLVERSLLQFQRSATGEARYVMLETIREYALEQLEAGDDGDRVRARQVAWYLAFAQRGNAEINGAQGKVWLQRLEAEQDNFRAILQRFVDGHSVESETGLALVTALSRFWHRAGYWIEGRRWLLAALERGMDASDMARARVLRHLASSLINQGDSEAALSYAEESLALARSAGDAALLADVLYVIGYICFSRQAYDRAQYYLEESLTLLEQSEQRVTRQNVLDTLGYLCLSQGNDTGAQSYYTQLMTLAREAGDTNALGRALNGLGELARVQGTYAEAEHYYVAGLHELQQAGARGAETSLLPNLGHALLQQGKLEQAVAVFRRCLVLAHELGDKQSALQCLTGFAAAAMAAHDFGHAAQLASAVQQLLAAHELILERTDRIDFEGVLSLLQAQLAEPPIHAAWVYGQALNLEEAIVLALSR